jgi:uncharacterized protein (TIGR00369 family)
MDGSDDSELRRRLALMNEALPHGRALGFRLTEVGPSTATLAVDWRGDLADGDVILANGVVVALIDQACGLAVQATLPAFALIATLDLRLDYLRPAKSNAGLVARAECFHRTRHIAHVRAFAHDGDESDPVVAAQAAFMLETAR